MSDARIQKHRQLVPPAIELREQLAEAVRRVSVLKRLLRVAEHAEQIQQRSIPPHGDNHRGRGAGHGR